MVKKAVVYEVSELDLARIALRAAEREFNDYLARTEKGWRWAIEYQRYSEAVTACRKKVQELETAQKEVNDT